MLRCNRSKHSLIQYCAYSVDAIAYCILSKTSSTLEILLLLAAADCVKVALAGTE